MKELQQALGYSFHRPELLAQALTHKSFSYEQKVGLGHNEKLEFLGDAVLALVLSEQLMELFPEQDEGALSKKRASLVNESSLARVALELQLDQQLRLGRGESQSGGSNKPRLLASVWEALVGALFLDAGFDVTRMIVRKRFSSLLQELRPEESFMADFKTRLQELVQKVHKVTPAYELISEAGPPHERHFVVSIKVGDEEWGRGLGKSKKAAEQAAAKDAFERKQGG